MQRILGFGFVVLLLNCGAPGLGAESLAPLEVAEEYLAAVEAGNLDRAGRLFADGSLVFESGGVEGAWEDYRRHHLGAEIDAIETFEIRRGPSPRVDVAKDGSLAAVAWPIEYRIELADGELIESRGTVTFVLQAVAGDYKIAQLHWSSRRLPKDTPGPSADGGGETGTADGPAIGVSMEEAVATAREQFDFEPRSAEVEAVEEGGRRAWKVTLRGRAPEPGVSMGEFGSVVIDRQSGRILTISMS